MIKTLESVINTQMNIINDDIIDIHPSTPRNDTLPVTQPKPIPKVSQALPTFKKITDIKNTLTTQEDTNEDPNTQETTNSITENGDDIIYWEDENNSEDYLSDINIEKHQRVEVEEEEGEKEVSTIIITQKNKGVTLSKWKTSLKQKG